MVVGTAGVTAAMCVDYLQRFGEVQPSHGPVLVTGAAGGLGQVAVALLHARGFEVVASTGRAEALGDHLRALGASDVVGRLQPEPKPLGKQLWAGVVDSVGGATLAAALAQTRYRGAVASPGVAGGGGQSARGAAGDCARLTSPPPFGRG
uniref:Alcohol dehydrogenase-like C-terminal domain-containing protein n=2 Tax=Emiliania huxleyi TaxID=2903 RepID=A0A7S3SM07_EMIHU